MKSQYLPAPGESTEEQYQNTSSMMVAEIIRASQAYRAARNYLAECVKEVFPIGRKIKLAYAHYWDRTEFEVTGYKQDECGEVMLEVTRPGACFLIHPGNPAHHITHVSPETPKA